MRWFWVCVGLLGFSASALEGESADNWRQDILYFQETLKDKHLNPFHSVTESTFDTQIADLLNQLTQLNEEQVQVALMGIARSVNDAHTQYGVMSGPHQHYPFRFKYFGNSLYVIGTNKAHQHLMGTQLLAINDVPINQVFERLKPYLQGVENPYSERAAMAFQVTLTQLLYGAGITNQLEQTSFKFLQGENELNVPVMSVPMREFAKTEDNLLAPKLPLWKISDLMPGVSIGYNKKHKLSYIGLAQYPELSTVQEKCSKLQSKLKKHRSKRLVIDLRDNQGGSFYVGLAISACILNMPQFDWENGIFALINNKTQSAAMSNAAQFRQILNAKLVGEPTGADPNHYMETGVFQLPNSGRTIRHSTRYYRFIETPTDALYPDIEVATTWAAYSNGKDEVMEAVFDLLP